MVNAFFFFSFFPLFPQFNPYDLQRWEIRSHLPHTFSDRKKQKELRKQRVAARYSYTFWYLNSSKTVCLSQSEWWLAFLVSPLDKYKGPQLLKSDGKTVANPSVLKAKMQGCITHRARMYMAKHNIKWHLDTSSYMNNNHYHQTWTFQLKNSKHS